MGNPSREKLVCMQPVEVSGQIFSDQTGWLPRFSEGGTGQRWCCINLRVVSLIRYIPGNGLLTVCPILYFKCSHLIYAHVCTYIMPPCQGSPMHLWKSLFGPFCDNQWRYKLLLFDFVTELFYHTQTATPGRPGPAEQGSAERSQKDSPVRRESKGTRSVVPRRTPLEWRPTCICH